MATRAQIRVKDEYGYIDLYHHCDGYPEGIGRDLKKYCNTLPNGQWAYWSVRITANQLLKGAISEEIDGEVQKDMSYEVTNGFHSDIEYAYLIDCEKKELKCYYVDFESDYRSLEQIFESAKEVEIPV